MSPIEIEALCDGDHVDVHFEPPRQEPDVGEIARASGQVRCIVGQVYLACENHRSDLGLPTMIRIDDAPPRRIALVETHAEAKARLRAAALGAIVFTEAPATREEVEHQLLCLADLIAAEPRDATADMLGRTRRSQLVAQFDALADRIALARAKRVYLLAKGEIGADFHPWTTQDPRVFRNGTVRPLVSDFHLDRSERIDRDRRKEEACRIFGEAERETRALASRLRALGYAVRRPHPNAQELLVRIDENGKALGDLRISPSANGLWEAALYPVSNKRQAKAGRRLTRNGHLDRLRGIIDDWIRSRE